MATPNEIASASVCFKCLDSKQFAAALLYLLNATLEAQGGEAMTIGEVVQNSVCWTCLDSKQSQAAELYLMDAVVDAGGSGLQYVEYTVAPPANPADQTKAAIAFDPTGALPTLFWNTGDQAWH